MFLTRDSWIKSGIKMKRKLKCEVCGCKFEVEEDLVTEKFIQCPICGEITENPLRE